MEQANEGADEAMNAYFNDVTLKPSPKENMLYLPDLKMIWEEFERGTKGRIGKMISLPFCDNDNKPTQLGELAEEVWQSRKRDLIDFFSHKITAGFRQEIEQAKDSDVGNKYYISEYRVSISPEEEVECRILGWAMLNQGIAFGLASSPFWNRSSPDVDLIVEDLEKGESHETVCCVTRREHLGKIEYHGLCDDDETDEVCDPPAIVQRRLKGKIKVLGAESVNDLQQVAGKLGFDIKRFDFVPYDRLTNFDCRRWKDTKDIAAIMIGPLPHSGAGMGDANNLKNAIREEKGYPPSIELEESTQKLKVTITSFRKGLDNLVKRKHIARNFDC